MRLAKVDARANGVLGQETLRISEELAHIYGYGTGILLFGSYINGRSDEYSDIDVLILDETCSVESHECVYMLSDKFDVHVLNTRILKKHLLCEKGSHTCFYVKMCSESLVIRNMSSIDNIRNMARYIYINPIPFNSWARLKVNLLSRLSGFYRKRDDFERTLYYADIATHIIRIMAIIHVGWVARMDVMIEWLRECAITEINIFNEYYYNALHGNPDSLYELGCSLAETICSSFDYHKSFIVREDEFRNTTSRLYALSR